MSSDKENSDEEIISELESKKKKLKELEKDMKDMLNSGVLVDYIKTLCWYLFVVFLFVVGYNISFPFGIISIIMSILMIVILVPMFPLVYEKIDKEDFDKKMKDIRIFASLGKERMSLIKEIDALTKVIEWSEKNGNLGKKSYSENNNGNSD